uniref:Alpha-2-macroglobulin-like n=1 Tax=Dicentrarchus labrax TaxID=13489 RepID=A0A8P4JYC5_DICLA
MGHLGIQMWTWTVCVLLSWMCVGQAVAGPQYMVAIPAVLEAGAETKFCASLLQPNETLVMTVTLMSQDKNTTLLQKTSSEAFHSCEQFQAPLVQNEVVQKLEVEVRGNTFYSKEVRKVMIKGYQPVTFIQTDKPIYLPGQTVPVLPIYFINQDANSNRIGQWLNQTSNGKILQLSYSLNSEAREGGYSVIVSIGESKLYHSFKVEKYVLPKFDVKIDSSDESNIEQEEIKAEVCAKYTYGQPVPGSVNVKVCRPLQRYLYGTPVSSIAMSKGSSSSEVPGISHPQEKRITISYVVGKLSIIDTPKIYDRGSNVEGKVSACLFLSVILYTKCKGSFILSDKTCSSNRSKQFITIIHPLLTCQCTCLRVNHGHHADDDYQYRSVVTVNEGEVSFKLKVSAEIAPEVQIVAYTILPSETVIAHSADFSTEKCFSHKVSLEFSPSSAVPGEETTLQVTAQPDSLCGVSAVDQSVLIKDYDSVPQINRMGVGLGAAPGPGMAFAESYPAPIETVRTFFPETWIWDLVEVGESGTKDVSLTVPDTITTWETEAFCLSPLGFGLAPRKEIKVFQPFFLELSLPYSIIRGEHFELKATTFNYLSSCIMVTVTPTPSLDYTLTPLSGDQYTSCLCGNERKTLSWTMAPSALGVMNVSVRAEALASQASCDNEIVSVPDRGRIDVVTRSLIVKAEGTEMTKTYNWLLCPKGQYEETDVQLPDNMIDGSARATLSVLGDILGRALNNLDGLLRMPYGCGEQNMALLAPNIYILQYLKNTQQLTPAIKEKATNFLTSGESRFKTFGYVKRTICNNLLTAFVLRSFAKAQSFIYIDPTNIEESKTWLKRKQRENGCFEQSGKLFNNRMKGGVSDEVTLSAYITAGFLEMNTPVKNPVVNQSLSCLKESISDLSNTYTTALLAYVFTLAGDMETRAHLLNHLDTVALNQGGFLHWSQTATETSASLSVEISSYVLLAKLSASPTAEDLGYAARIIRWITGQQNYYGGFSSTQDTVVALQALALYSSLVFSPGGSSTVTVQSPSGRLTFDVNQDNKLLYQEEVLKDMTGKYSLVVQGNACASVQISLHYNIRTPADVTTLSVEVKPEADCTGKSQRPKLTLKYSGKESTTNMVILDIKILSGFVPDPESLRRVSYYSALLVDRVEQKEDHVLVYIQELPKDIPINHNLELIQELPVQNLKPAVVKIYDYYQPSKTLSPFTDHSTH